MEEEVDENDMRLRIIEQLRESLAMSREMMTNRKLDPKTRESWAQLHTNTSQVLNQILKDKQRRDWEKRLRELEASGHIPRRTIRARDPASNDDNRSVTL